MDPGCKGLQAPRWECELCAHILLRPLYLKILDPPPGGGGGGGGTQIIFKKIKNTKYMDFGVTEWIPVMILLFKLASFSPYFGFGAVKLD